MSLQHGLSSVVAAAATVFLLPASATVAGASQNGSNIGEKYSNYYPYNHGSGVAHHGRRCRAQPPPRPTASTRIPLRGSLATTPPTPEARSLPASSSSRRSALHRRRCRAQIPPRPTASALSMGIRCGSARTFTIATAVCCSPRTPHACTPRPATARLERALPPIPSVSPPAHPSAPLMAFGAIAGTKTVAVLERSTRTTIPTITDRESPTMADAAAPNLHRGRLPPREFPCEALWRPHRLLQRRGACRRPAPQGEARSTADAAAPKSHAADRLRSLDGDPLRQCQVVHHRHRSLFTTDATCMHPAAGHRAPGARSSTCSQCVAAGSLERAADGLRCYRRHQDHRCAGKSSPPAGVAPGSTISLPCRCNTVSPLSLLLPPPCFSFLLLPLSLELARMDQT
ncbi:uncharacterized protein [Triticum aestivum]|uniref:uncharacterized protein isoform X1 n=1 Tax=Triticum aestivum TaxID=4565 RepID=UPI001D0093CC|nr:uncharacterized protein LOC123137310 isoform X1 [Triticum aestivum]XP_044412950.1 uncharacterized protein LOC123137310 isoform X1 [Triticum aestivum]